MQELDHKQEQGPGILMWRWLRAPCRYLCVLVAQLCPTVCDPTDCSPSGSYVHGILQKRILELIAIPFSRGSAQPRDWIQVSNIAESFFTVWATTKNNLKVDQPTIQGHVNTISGRSRSNYEKISNALRYG